MRARHILAGLVGLAALGGVGFLALAWRSAIDPIDPPARAAFDRARIEEGARLAAIGNCNVCHQADGGKPYAGGRGIATPFGTIYATNITPEPETGIGRWSEAAFVRSLREGVDREGRHLYPAFPYDHYAKVTDGDAGALYAFLMTREPVRATAPRNELPFPLDQRVLLAGWKLLFHDDERFRPDPARDEAWNRGAYLAEGLGHCAACHSPRNALGAEKGGADMYAGGVSDGWHAPALNAASPAPVPWTAESLYAYLRHGFDPRHGLAAGPMGPVSRNLAFAPDSDVRAIAAYVASTIGSAPPDRAERAQAFARDRAYGAVPVAAGPGDAGAAIFAGACATCHREGGPRQSFQPSPLALSSTVAGPDPANLIHVILGGIRPPPGERGPIMPGFAETLTDAQAASLVAYVRGHFSDRPAWAGIEDKVRSLRSGAEGKRGEAS